MNVEKGQSILFTGDSITDCGRARPVGTGLQLGDGYVSILDSTITVTRPGDGITIMNTGISGNRVTDLKARWDQDVLNINPDWLSVMIGINDVCFQFTNTMAGSRVSEELYESTYREILAAARPRLKGLILMTPYLIEADRQNPIRKKMDEYGKIVLQLANEFEAISVNVQAAFDAYLEHRPAESLCDDQVHPNRIGHMIIAEAFLAATDITPK